VRKRVIGFTKEVRMMHRWLASLLALTMALPAVAQAPADSLAVTVKALDTKLFDAYNHCDLQTLGALVADDLEFYHDKTGLAVGKGPFLKSTQAYICGKVTRTLVASSLEVYPLDTYGAVEIGVHQFHHVGESPTDPPGEAKFVMLWQKKGNGWKLTRVISYDHASLAK